MFESSDPPKIAHAEDLEDLYQNAPCGYASMHPDGRFFKVNATFANWIGYSPEQLAGKRLHELLTVGTRILYETNYAPLLSMQGAFEEISLDLRTADGKALAVLASGKIRRDENGQPLLIRVAFLKAAERRRYERQLVEAREEIQRLEGVKREMLQTERENSELREQFIAVLGHDLRNPLASLSSGLRLLQKDQPPDRRKLLFEMLQGSIWRMSGLIDDILDFARGRLGSGIPLDLKTDVMLKPILEQVVSELRLSVPDRVIEANLNVLVPIKCDPSRIGQLVSNLLGNAITHGSSVKPVRVYAASSNGLLMVWVANAGDPISPAAIERLFQPFFRGEVRHSREGLGLGLYIASAIAKAHGGALSVESSTEETRFTSQMPVHRA